MNFKLFPVAKEGWQYIGFSFLLSVVFTVLNLSILAFLLFIITLFFIYLFRNPERELPRFERNSVISPVDGTVLSIDELNNSDYAYKVTIDSSYMDVSILRSPVSGSVYSIDKKFGTRLDSDNKLANKLNEKMEIVFEDSDSNKLKVFHSLKQSVDNINADIISSQNLTQTSRYGVMLNGLTSIYLPRNFRLNVSVESEIKGAETLIGYFS